MLLRKSSSLTAAPSYPVTPRPNTSLARWRRPALAPRDRSLVTVSALIASGQVAQITFHLNPAMDNGLTKAQASEVLTHLLFYAGWPNVMSAVPVAKDEESIDNCAR